MVFRAATASISQWRAQGGRREQNRQKMCTAKNRPYKKYKLKWTNTTRVQCCQYYFSGDAHIDNFPMEINYHNLILKIKVDVEKFCQSHSIRRASFCQCISCQSPIAITIPHSFNQNSGFHFYWSWPESIMLFWLQLGHISAQQS